MPDSLPGKAAACLAAIEDLSGRIALGHERSALSDALLGALAEMAAANRGSLMLRSRETGRLEVVAGRSLPPEAVDSNEPQRRRRVCDWVFRERQSVVLHGRIEDERFEGSDEGARIASAMSVPLFDDAGAIGVLNLARQGGRLFSRDDVAAVEWLAASLVGAIDDLDRTEAGRTARSQLADLAQIGYLGRLGSGPHLARHYRLGLRVAPASSPAGDFVDRVIHADGAQTVIMGDVTGHGPQAFAVGAFVQGLFVALSRGGVPPAMIAARLDEELASRSGSSVNVGAWIAQLSPGGRLISCTAGCVPPLCVDLQGRRPLRLVAGGPAIGSGCAHTFDQQVVQLLPGDLVVGVSDGILREANTQGLEFGWARARDTILEFRSQSPDFLADRVCLTAMDFSRARTPVDDLVVLAVRYMRNG